MVAKRVLVLLALTLINSFTYGIAREYQDYNDYGVGVDNEQETEYTEMDKGQVDEFPEEELYQEGPLKEGPEEGKIQDGEVQVDEEDQRYESEGEWPIDGEEEPQEGEVQVDEEDQGYKSEGEWPIDGEEEPQEGEVQEKEAQVDEGGDEPLDEKKNYRKLFTDMFNKLMENTNNLAKVEIIEKIYEDYKEDTPWQLGDKTLSPTEYILTGLDQIELKDPKNSTNMFNGDDLNFKINAEGLKFEVVAKLRTIKKTGMFAKLFSDKSDTKPKHVTTDFKYKPFNINLKLGVREDKFVWKKIEIDDLKIDNIVMDDFTLEDERKEKLIKKAKKMITSMVKEQYKAVFKNAVKIFRFEPETDISNSDYE